MDPAKKQQRASAVIAECMRRADAGKSVNVQQILTQYPELADELQAHFDSERMLGNALGAADVAAIRRSDIPHAKRDTVPPGASDSVPTGGDSFDNLPIEFGRYRVQKVLGQGAMGAVYLAHDTKLARDVALKTPKLDVFADGGLIERFEREARAAATLHHRNICPVFDVGEIDGIRFLTMAYIEGKPLSAFVSEDRPMSRRQAATVVRKLALGLNEAHAQGVVHRDLKPANVMIDKSGEPVVMDFGLAHQTEDAQKSRLTGVGVLMGSPAYMSPEQVSGEPDAVGHATDIYSLGVILFELLTGRLPFEGGVAAIIGQILTSDPPDVRTLRPVIQEDLAQICSKMMAKSPEERFASMKDVADALGVYLRDFKRNASAGSGVQSITTTGFIANNTADDIAENFVPPSLPRSVRPRTGTKTAGRTVRSRTTDRALRIGGGLLGFILLAGVVIKFRDGTTVEIPDGKITAIETNKDGALKNITVTSKAADAGQPRTDILSPAKPPPADEGFVDLFNGHDLSGWQMKNAGWSVKNGVLIGSGREWIMSDADFSDFELELDYLLAKGGNSGVFLRAWPEGRGSGADLHEIQLLDDNDQRYSGIPDTQRNGALWNEIAARPVLRPAPNEWHHLRIVVAGDHVTVSVNGIQVTDGQLPPGKPSRGRIGLQAHQSHVEFRNIRIKEHLDSERSVTPNNAIVSSVQQGTITISTQGDASQLAVSPNGNHVVATGVDAPGRFTVWDTENGNQIVQFDDPSRPGHPTNYLSYSPDGTSLLYCTGNEVRVVSVADGAEQATFNFPAPPTLVVFPKRTIALALYYEQEAKRKQRFNVTQRLRIWDWKKQVILHDDVAPNQLASYAAVSPHERFVTLHAEHNHIRYTLEIDGDDVALTTPTDFEQTSRVRGPLVFSPDGRYAATSVKNNEYMAAILDVQTGRVITRLDPATAKTENQGHLYGCSLGFGPDGTQIVMADHTGRAALWDVATGKLIEEVEQLQKEGNHSAPGVAVSRNGVAILGGGTADRRITVRRLHHNE